VQRNHAIVVVAATAAAAVIRLTSGSNETSKSVEDAAAVKIQCVFRLVFESLKF